MAVYLACCVRSRVYAVLRVDVIDSFNRESFANDSSPSLENVQESVDVTKGAGGSQDTFPNFCVVGIVQNKASLYGERVLDCVRSKNTLFDCRMMTIEKNSKQSNTRVVHGNDADRFDRAKRQGAKPPQ